MRIEQMLNGDSYADALNTLNERMKENQMTEKKEEKLPTEILAQDENGQFVYPLRLAENGFLVTEEGEARLHQVFKPLQKTAVIFNQYSKGISYLIVNEDWTRFQGIEVNEYTDDKEKEDLQRELNKVLYDEEGYLKHEGRTLNEFAQAIREGALIVECGFIP